MVPAEDIFLLTIMFLIAHISFEMSAKNIHISYWKEKDGPLPDPYWFVEQIWFVPLHYKHTQSSIFLQPIRFLWGWGSTWYQKEKEQYTESYPASSIGTRYRGIRNHLPDSWEQTPSLKEGASGGAILIIKEFFKVHRTRTRLAASFLTKQVSVFNRIHNLPQGPQERMNKTY